MRQKLLGGLAIFLFVLIVLYLRGDRDSLVPLPMTTFGGQAKVFRFLVDRGGEIRVSTVGEQNKERGVSRYVAGDADRAIGLAMLPGRGAGEEREASLDQSACFGWYDAGDPVIGVPFPAHVVNVPAKYSFGMNGIAIEDSTWQLVSVPKGAQGVTLVRVPQEVTPADLSTLIAAIPGNARWSTYQAENLIRAIVGSKDEALRAHLPTAIARAAELPGEYAKSSDYVARLRLRAKPCESLLTIWAGPATSAAVSPAMFDWGSFGYRMEKGVWELTHKSGAKAQSLGGQTLDQILVILSVLDPQKWDAAATARAATTTSAPLTMEMMLRVGRMPAGSGEVLADRFIGEIRNALPMSDVGRLYHTNSPVLMAFKMIQRDGVAAGEALKFLDRLEQCDIPALVDATKQIRFGPSR